MSLEKLETSHPFPAQVPPSLRSRVTSCFDCSKLVRVGAKELLGGIDPADIAALLKMTKEAVETAMGAKAVVDDAKTLKDGETEISRLDDSVTCEFPTAFDNERKLLTTVIVVLSFSKFF